jgi:putative peptidoglycan lipid II flippase
MLLRGTAIVSLLTLISRILGFIRDLLVANLLGASLFADAFFVAFRIPNLLRSFVAEGALTSAFLPVFSTSLNRGIDSARATVRRLVGFLLILTTFITLALIFFAPQIVSLIAPGFKSEQDKFDLCISLTRIMAPYIACVSLIAMINGALNALNVFGTSAFAQVIMNVVLILGAALALPFNMESATWILALSVLLGGIVQVLTQIPACHKQGLSILPSSNIISPDIADVIRLMIPAVLGASVYQISIFLSTLLASLLPSGSVSWLFYADRIAQFPIGIFSVALASVLFPSLTNASARSDESAFKTNLANSIRYTSFFIIPMSCGIYVLALPITQLLFERGAFDIKSSVNTAAAVKALALGLWCASAHSMVVRALIAKRDTVTPGIIGAVSLLSNLLFALLLIGPLDTQTNNPGLLSDTAITLQRALLTGTGTSFSLGHAGLAMSSSAATVVSLTLVIAAFARRTGYFPWVAFISSTLRALIASFAMIATIGVAIGLFPTPLAKVFVGILVGAGSYLLASFALRSRELKECLAIIKGSRLPLLKGARKASGRSS